MTLRIDLTDRHSKHSQDVRDYVTEKVSKLTHYFDKVNHIEVTLDQENDLHVVDVHVIADPHMHFVGHASNESVMVCVDRVVDKLERQVKKAKERLRDHHRGDAGHKAP